MRIFSLFLLQFMLLISTSSYSQEAITQYDVTVKVRKDRSLWVLEEIKVNVEGDKIVHGIFRDIINVMQDSSGNYYRYKTFIREVKRDGIDETYRMIKDSDFLRVQIGDEESELIHKEYTYTITYTMAGQVRYFEDHDEIYWNAIGSYWEFPVLQSSVSVELPDEAQIKNVYAYSGPLGSVDCDCSFRPSASNKATFKLNNGLESQEGFTVSVSWDKGVIAPPSSADLRSDRSHMMRSRKYALWIMYGSAILILAFYYLIWRKVGKDPKKGAIIPRWDPPQNLPPSAMRYIYKMGFDRQVMPTCLISTAVKGRIEIEQEKGFFLKKITDSSHSELSPDEQITLDKIFEKEEILEVDNVNSSTFEGAAIELQKHLRKTYKKVNFSQNYWWLVPGVMASLGAYIFSMIYLRENNVISLLTFSMMFLLFIFITIKSRRKTRLYTAFFALSFGAGAIAYFFKETAVDASIAFIPGAAVLFLCNFIFYYLLPAPTKEGRKLMDHIAGFKLYLSTAEKDRLNLLNPPEENLELFESLFPYALALGVEQKWSEKFRDKLDQEEYKPSWYQSTIHSTSIAGMTSAMGSSFTSSVSSASSSSSGSSGSSGGGGGGGGGGGW